VNGDFYYAQDERVCKNPFAPGTVRTEPVEVRTVTRNPFVLSLSKYEWWCLSLFPVIFRRCSGRTGDSKIRSYSRARHGRALRQAQESPVEVQTVTKNPFVLSLSKYEWW